ncbi:MAG TPA: lipid-A-disaccharide synthase [Candidatus Omnitrophota bacterium]|nr:lipid-A-disaccharide synthase [Candidatus Omnitrophota bacterium]
MAKIMLSAGEVSGDVHASYLVNELRKLIPDSIFFGMGSDRLRSVGVDVRIDISRRGTIGILEAIPNAIPIYFSFRKLVSFLNADRPDLLILVDSQGINVPLALAARKLGIKTVYYLSPQEWLWGSPAGVKKIADSLDLIIAIFEPEYNAYLSAGANVFYSGHPLIDIVKPSLSPDDARLKYLGDTKSPFPVISLCPGSRKQEVFGLFPLLLDSADIIRRAFPSARFLIPASAPFYLDYFKEHAASRKADVFPGGTYDILSISDLAICASGTINLEASILGVPNLMIYKLSAISYLIGKYLLKIDRKLKYFSMPNLLLDKLVVPELIMGNASSVNISSESISMLSDPSRIENIRNSFCSLRSHLGSSGVIRRAAERISVLLA